MLRLDIHVCQKSSKKKNLTIQPPPLSSEHRILLDNFSTPSFLISQRQRRFFAMHKAIIEARTTAVPRETCRGLNTSKQIGRKRQRNNAFPFSFFETDPGSIYQYSIPLGEEDLLLRRLIAKERGGFWVFRDTKRVGLLLLLSNELFFSFVFSGKVVNLRKRTDMLAFYVVYIH
ncbi:hypothetical protein JTE90_014721 [Oedothorax gibbosus]|uniref:Uncharacterized protein n=1 Tax=Oedothorax gibbosus TaxID=931172 RepID=A0AAV6UQF4_9ARAC|nr:hypothetical protein JTE90_014721 [Oedothorax gibbosus]